MEVGVFTTDTSLVVQTWDAWMSHATGLSEAAACGQLLTNLFPDLGPRGMVGRLRRVAEGRGVEVLAPAFHKYLIPCRPRHALPGIDRMRQHVTMAPLREQGRVVGVVVTIEDVTGRFDHDKRLADALQSSDEATRVHAAEELAEHGESPDLLVGSLGDESWRVRRIAADGLARGGGAHVTARLLDALQERHRNPAVLNAVLTALVRTRDDTGQAVTELLASEDAEVRTYGALALGLMGDSRAVAPLMTLLQDDDTNVRFHAIEALGRIGDAEPVDALAAIAESRDFFLAFAALDAIGLIGEPAVASRVVALLDDEVLFPAVAACLGAIGAEDVVPALTPFVKGGPMVIPAVVALAAIHDRIDSQLGEGSLVADLTRAALSCEAAFALVGALAAATESEGRAALLVLSWLACDGIETILAQYLSEPGLRQFAVQFLVRRGVAATSAVTVAASGDTAEERQAAAEVLGRIGSSESVPALLGLLNDEPSVIVAAANALGAIGDRGAFEPLLEALDSPESMVRQAAISALNSIGHPRMEEAITGRLTDASPRVREAAARIAGYFGYQSSLRRLVELCDDEDEAVRRAAVEHLANYDQRQAWSKIHETLMGDGSASVRAAAARAMGRAGNDAARDALVRAAGDENLWVRYFAVRSLGRQDRETHAQTLACLAERATRDEAPPVRIAAIEAIAMIGSGTMVQVLLPLVHEPNLEIASAAVVALGAFDPARAAPSVLFALHSQEPRLVRAALGALGRPAAGHAVNAIRWFVLESRDDDLRLLAIEALGRIGDSAAIEALVQFSDDRRLREAVVVALTEIDDAHVDDLRRVLNDPDRRRRRLIVDAMSRSRGPSAGAVLASALEDESESIRLAAARGLSRRDAAGARARLAALNRADSSRVAAGIAPAGPGR